jgi:hypothetical protein
MTDDPDPNGAKPKPAQTLLQLMPTLLYGLIALTILGVIGWGLWNKGGFLKSLQDIPVARGLITFLIVITTMGIAIMLAISTLFGEDGGDQDKTFDKGKQVLGVLIGLLGTIVGFYFGSPDTKAAQAQMPTVQTQGPTIAPARVNNLQPKKGETFTISDYAYDGKPPYTYSITFDPAAIPPIKDIKSDSGVLDQKITVPDTISADTDVKYQIHVADSENKFADYNKDGTQRIYLKAK